MSSLTLVNAAEGPWPNKDPRMSSNYIVMRFEHTRRVPQSPGENVLDKEQMDVIAVCADESWAKDICDLLNDRTSDEDVEYRVGSCRLDFG